MSKKQVMKDILSEKINQDKIYQNVLSKVKEEEHMNKVRNKKIIYGITSSVAMLVLCIGVIINYNKPINNKNQLGKVDNSNVEYVNNEKEVAQNDNIIFNTESIKNAVSISGKVVDVDGEWKDTNLEGEFGYIKNIDILKQYQCILSPDFSLYMDMPMPMKIWNIYRSRAIGQYYQEQGIKVIPTISWAEKETFEFCFDGIPKGSIVSISTIGVKQNKEAFKIWKQGVDELIKRINPSTILIYGGKVDYDYKDIKVIYYKNKVIERMVR